MFFILGLVIYDILEKSFSFKKYLLSSLPFIAYLILGSFLKHNDLFWWFNGYSDSSSDLNFVVFSGIADNIYSGFVGKKLFDIVQASLLLMIYLIYVFFFIKGLLSRNNKAVLFYLPGILILPFLPKSEINSFVHYSYFGFFGLFIEFKEMEVFKAIPIKFSLLFLFVSFQLFFILYAYKLLR